MNAPQYWILLRGLTRDARHWEDLPPALAARMPGVTVTPVDLPGNGARYAEASPTSVAAMAAACRAEVLKAGITPPFGLLGLSLGAMVAVAWAEAWPEELAACVLVNTSLRPMSPWYRRLRPAAYGQLIAALLSRDVRLRERSVLAVTSHRFPAGTTRRDVLLDRWAAWGSSAPVSRGNALRQLLAAARFRASTTAPKMPTLLLASTTDRLVDVQCTRTLAKAWGCPLVEHPWAGHDLPLDDREWLIDQLVSWLHDDAGKTSPSSPRATLVI